MSTPFAPVQATTKTAVSVASVTTTAMTTQSGDLFVAIVTCFTNKIGTTPLSDSKGNTWVQAVASTGTTNGFTAMYYVANGTGGAGHTFTFTPTAADFIAISVIEISGAALSSVLSQTNGAVANSTTHTTGSITAGATDEVFIGGGAVSQSAEGTPVLNKTLWWGVAALPDGSVEGIVSAFRFVGTGVADTFSYTTSSASNEGVVIAGFKSAAVASSAGTAHTFFGG